MLPDLMQRALDHNADLEAARKRVNAASAEAWQQLAAFQPEVSAESGWVNEDLDVSKDNYLYAYLEGRWNLYRGGYDCAELNIRKGAHHIAYLEYEKQRKALLRNVWREFTQLLYYQELARIMDDALKVNAQHKSMAQKKKGSGLATETDVMEFELYKSELESEMRCNLKEMHQHRHAIALLLGAPEEGCKFSVEGDFTEIHDSDYCQLYQDALRLREDKRQLEEAICINGEQRKQSWSAFRPKVDLRASWGKEPAEEEDRGFGSIVELSVSIPLYDGRSGYNKRQAICSERQALYNENLQLERSVYAELGTLMCRLELLKEKIDVALQRLDKIQGFWTLTQEEYNRGVRGSMDLAAASDRRLRLQIEILSLRRERTLAIIDLSAAIGSDPSELSTLTADAALFCGSVSS